MGGWNIFYALVNFAVLALGLYLACKKLVAGMLESNRRRISEALESAEKAKQKAQSLDSDLAELEGSARTEREALLATAQDRAREELRQGEERLKALNENAEELRRQEAQSLLREELLALKDEKSPELIAAAAAELSGEKYAAAREALESAFPEKVAPLLTLSKADQAGLRWGKKLEATLLGANEKALERGQSVRRLAEELAGAENISFTTETDPSLIGGLRLTVGDAVYDYSLGGMLERLKNDILSDSDIGEDLGVYFSRRFAGAGNAVGVSQVGRVLSLAEGICRISGLSDVMAGELVELDGGVRGMVMDVEKDSVSAVLLEGRSDIQSGDPVRRTGKVVETPVGEALIGRIVDGIGSPLDGLGPLHQETFRPVESPAPGIIARRSVSVPLQTGIMAIDALVPIGRGQRELIIGDRQTGKTSIAIDAILNQKDKGVVCIYVAIGQKESTVAAVVDRLRRAGAMDYTVVVNANASDSAALQYLAPYTGAAIGEYFMYKGRDALIIYDDLSKHAVAYRELALLLHRPPGREAYPGDVFYLHSRLLERAACLSEENGGGSLTALPIVETQAGDISAYIPTNVISITDGQIFLSTAMFNSGNRPAVDAGLSVSRVGGAAQPKSVKQLAARLRMDLAQYRELEAFSQFGADLDKATRDSLNRGRKLTQLMIQKRYAPQTTTEQVTAIFAANEGALDDVEQDRIESFREGLGRFVYGSDPDLARHIDGGGKLDEGQLARLRALTAEFKQGFTRSGEQD